MGRNSTCTNIYSFSYPFLGLMKSCAMIQLNGCVVKLMCQAAWQNCDVFARDQTTQ
jgi:hypothetical protein